MAPLLLVARPKPLMEKGPAALALQTWLDDSRKLGFNAQAFALARHQLLPGSLPLPQNYAGLIATSSTALEAASLLHLDPAWKERPFFAVGKATAQAARLLGFTHCYTGKGRARDLPELIAPSKEKRPFLYLCAQDRAFDLKAALAKQAILLEERKLYQTQALPLKPLLDQLETLGQTAQLFHGLLFSAANAKRFSRLWLEFQRRLPDSALLLGKLFCISPEVAKACLGLEKADFRVPERPEKALLLDLLDKEKKVLLQR